MSNVKYRQMVFQSVDGAVVASFLEPLGQTKVPPDRDAMKFVLICLNRMDLNSSSISYLHFAPCCTTFYII